MPGIKREELEHCVCGGNILTRAVPTCPLVWGKTEDKESMRRHAACFVSILLSLLSLGLWASPVIFHCWTSISLVPSLKHPQMVASGFRLQEEKRILGYYLFPSLQPLFVTQSCVSSHYKWVYLHGILALLQPPPPPVPGILGTLITKQQPTIGGLSATGNCSYR